MDNLSAKGTLEVEAVLKNAREVTRDIALLGEKADATTADFDRLARKSQQVEQGLRKITQATNGQTQSLKAANAAWDRQDKIYNDYLRHQEKANAGLTANSGLVRSNTTSLIAQRYALYDVATTYAAISAASLLAAGYAVKVGADFESAFTNVERTSSDSLAGLQALRGELIDLSTQVPLTFAQLSQIATLGNQLGIPEDQIASFTQTVSKFATVTGLSVEAAATAFGSLGELLNLAPQDYEKLGSAIALVGRNSVATEAEIVALTTRLAASATNAGFSAQEVIALSGALASLRVAPERAQGVLEVYFNRLNNALAKGGDELQSFANIAGMTTDEVRALTRTDPNKFFREFSAGLGRLDPVSQTQALQALGLAGIRAGEVFGRVSGNLGVFDKALTDSNSAYTAGTELAEQYAKVVDDLNSRWMMFVNSINALIEALSGGAVSGLAGMLEQLTLIVNQLREFADNPIVQFLATVGLALTAAIGVFFAYRSAVALATASVYALTTAQAGLAASGTRLGLGGLTTSFLTMTAAAGGATTKVGALRGALAGLGKATALLALADLLYNLIFLWEENARAAEDFAKSIGIWIDPAQSNLREFNGLTIGVSGGFIRMGNAAISAGDAILGALAPGLFLVRLLAGAFNALPTKGRAIGGAGIPKAATQSVNDYSDALGSIGGGGGGGSAGEAAKEIRTLVDYANDLSEVFKRSFDIRFGGQQGLDAITSGWISIANATEEANKRIEGYRTTMQSLTADRAIKEYWLSVAENYGDALRAGELRAELAGIDRELADTAKLLSKEQDKNSKSLVGNTEGSIANRAEILKLVTEYQSYLTALAASGLSQEELRVKAAQLKADFMAQATQLGYNQSELQTYAAAFDDVTYAINNVPRNITVDANMNPAIQALNEYLARVNASKASPSIGGGGGAAGAADGAAYASAFTQAMRGYAQHNPVLVKGYSGADRWDPLFQFFAAGGYTGDGGKYEPKGIVHGGEFVFSKAAVKNIGVGNLAYAHNMAKRGKGYADGGPVGFAASSIAGFSQFSPEDRKLLIQIRDAIDRKPVISEGDIASATSAAAINSARRRVS